MTPINILLITIGSAGDVHPFVGIGLELQRRGHNVALATNGHFRRLVERVKLRFIELGDEQHYLDGIKDKNIWHRTRAFKHVFQWGVAPLVKPTYELVQRELAASGQTPLVVVGSSLAMGTRIAQEKLGVSTVTVHLAPSILRSLVDPPILPGLWLPAWLPVSIKRGIFEGGDKFVIDPIVGACINPLRQELGLPAVTGMLHWWNSPLRTLGLFPDWYAFAPDWPEQVRLTHFPLWDETGVSPISAELGKFLQAGPPPIAFTAGSAMLHGERFFERSLQAAQRLNRRALLLTRHADQLPKSLPAWAKHVPYAPFSQLLPRCAALVHHGGVGTTAQALAAGLPQLITPMAHDQPDNANRVKRLGVGDAVRPSFYTPGRVARKLHRLMSDPGVSLACKKTKLRFLGVDPLAKTCDEIEAILPQEPQSPLNP